MNPTYSLCDTDHTSKSVAIVEVKSNPQYISSCIAEPSASLHNINAVLSSSKSPCTIIPTRTRTLTTIKCVSSCDTKPAKLSTMCLLNTRSIKNKAPFIKDFIVDRGIDFIGITETWLDSKGKHKHIVKDVVPTGYKMQHTPRSSGRGGGNGIIYNKALDIKLQSTLEVKSFEYMECLLKSNGDWLRIIVLYRPPPSKRNELTAGKFFDEFSILLEKLATASGELLMIGDFNFHVESDKSDAVRFMSMLDNYGLKQHVDQPTHNHNHTLDLVITRSTESIVDDVRIEEPGFNTDHKAIVFKTTVEKPKYFRKTIKFRRWKALDLSAFTNDLSKSELFTNPSDNASDIVRQYNGTLCELADKHAPMLEKKVTVRPRAPWYTSEINAAKRSRRRLEHKWLKSALTVDRLAYKDQCQVVNNLIIETKKAYYNNKVESASGDQKSLFKIVNNMFHNTSEPQLPSHDSLDILVDRFADFFVTKINKIRHEIQLNNSCIYQPENDPINTIHAPLNEFEPTNPEEVRKLIMESPCKSGPADPIPSWIIKACLNVLVPVITIVVNLSLSSGEMPDDLKEAILTPMIKKICSDPEILNNFRPISNLTYISKLIEKIVAKRLSKHMAENNLHEVMQSSYKQHHSTETALTCVQDDFLRAVDSKKSVLLLMLDLSAAFDTVDHTILINRLRNRLGIGGIALRWFQSYLSNRKYCVKLNDVTSKYEKLDCGVPQGSVLGPILFTVYTLPLGDIIRKHDIPFHLYADDSQKYAIFELQDYASAVSKIELLVDDIRAWYSANMLKCNDPKTEMMVISSQFKPIDNFMSVKVGDISIPAATKIRNLGVIMDRHLTMESHLSNVVRTAFFKIREISYYRKFLTTSATKTLIHAYVTSRLDYCNGLLYGLPDKSINRLQSVLNTAARLVALKRKDDHITPVLKELHWLPIKFRIQFKILLLVFKSLNGMAPQYLSEKLNLRKNQGHRSDDKKLLEIPKSRVISYGDRAFSIAGPKLWNDLPEKLRLCTDPEPFRRMLKTHLFIKANHL